MRLCKILTSKMLWGIIVDILIALMVILLWTVLFAFSSSRPSYLLDKAQEALHLRPQQHRPAAPFALCFTKSCPSMNQPQAPEQTCSLWPAAQAPSKKPLPYLSCDQQAYCFPFKKKIKIRERGRWTLSNTLTTILQHEDRQRRKILKQKEKSQDFKWLLNSRRQSWRDLPASEGKPSTESSLSCASIIWRGAGRRG